MEILINYLDNMFANYPQTPEVMRAKDDLAEIMEDKYNELMEEGRTENEAIGIVISEFGNIRELAQELGIYPSSASAAQFSKDSPEQEDGNREDGTEERQEDEKGFDYGGPHNHSQKNIRQLSAIEAEEYLFAAKQSSVMLAAGVFLCVCSPVFLLLFAGMQYYYFMFPALEGIVQGIGIVLLLFMVACAVALFIRSGMKMEPYEYLKTECFMLDEDYEREFCQARESLRKKYYTKITAGVILCIFSVVPLLISAIITEYDNHDFYVLLCVIFLLVMIGTAVFLFVSSNMEMESYQVILQEKEYSVKNKKKQKAENLISSIFWPAVVCLYLAVSFITGGWQYTWLIWPLSAAAFDFICNIIGTKIKES